MVYLCRLSAKVLRESVSYFIDFANQISDKNPRLDQSNQEEVSFFIKEAIISSDLSTTFYNELKQKLSPLKVSILMLSNLLNKPNKLIQNIDNINSALLELEVFIKRRFEEPKLIRYVKKIDILYIEDNELERITVDRYFKEKSINIKSVETVEEAIDILNEFTPRAMLLDINLKTSKMNGDEFCQLLKSKEEYQDIPIILISALVSENEKKDMLICTRANGIITKPIEKLIELDEILNLI